MSTSLPYATALAAIIAAGLTTGAMAQASAADPLHPDMQLTQMMPPAEPGEAAGQGHGAQPGQPGMMSPGMMGEGMMGRGMMGRGMMGCMMQPGTMGGMMQPGMMRRMPMMHGRGHMMKIVFAIADADGDGALSFEEYAVIQRRIFDRMDADKNGKVTPEEVRTFMRE
jgi:hypothetical protein